MEKGLLQNKCEMLCHLWRGFDFVTALVFHYDRVVGREL